MMKYDVEKVSNHYNNLSGTFEVSPYRFELLKKISGKLPKGKVLDAGCGEGHLLDHLSRNGFECIGCDVSPKMLQKARKRLAGRAQLVETPLNDLKMLDSESFDHIFSIGVFHHISEEEEAVCYRELGRVLKPGGYFITSHQNELFDMFTFNKYTLRFFERNIYPLLAETTDIKLEDAKNKIASLITNPDKPVNADPKKSIRDILFSKPENPFSYPEKLAKYGFVNKEILYCHFHALPPLCGNVAAGKLEIKFANKWQGMFIGAHFVSVACKK